MLKKSLPLLLASLLLLLPAGSVRADDTADVQAQVRNFYHWYVHALNVKANAEPENSAQAHRYVSARFLKEIARQEKSPDGLEADPFLSAQDWDKDWEKNIRIKDMTPGDSRWKVQVELSGKEMTHRLNLVLVHEDKQWKIDKVSDGDTR